MTRYLALLVTSIGLSLTIINFASSTAQSVGEFDSTFRPDFPEIPPNVQAILVQPDQKILVCGAFSIVNGAAFQGIVRLNPDGSTDETFVPVTITPAPTISVMALEPDGSILIGGLFSAVNGVSRTGLARLTPNGSLDPSLGPVFEDWRGQIVRSISPLPNGQIIIAGQVSFIFKENGLQHSRSGIIRLNSNGGVDLSFGNDNTGSFGIETTLVQSNGRILVGGSFPRLNGQPVANIGRLNADGSLDSSFSATADGRVDSFTIQNDGKIIACGAFDVVNGVERRGIVRLSEDGALGKLFDPGAGFNGFVGQVRLQSDGKVVAGGNFSIADGTPRTGLARLNSDGSLDNSLNPVITRIEGGGTVVNAVAIQNDGKIVIGGVFNFVNEVSQNAVARLLPIPIPSPSPTPSATPTPTPTPTPSPSPTPSATPTPTPTPTYSHSESNCVSTSTAPRRIWFDSQSGSSY